MKKTNSNNNNNNNNNNIQLPYDIVIAPSFATFKEKVTVFMSSYSQPLFKIAL